MGDDAKIVAGISRRGALTGALSLPLAAGLAGSASAAPARANARILVAYFSRSGNTRVIAGQIRRAYGADLFEIVPANAYPEDYEATVRQAERERQAGTEPALVATVPDIAAYHTVFLGFPIWGTTAPAVIRSFLARHDLAGKTLVPFITHGGYGRGSSMAVLAAHAPAARILEGFTIRADQERETLAQVTQWLGGIDID